MLPQYGKERGGSCGRWCENDERVRGKLAHASHYAGHVLRKCARANYIGKKLSEFHRLRFDISECLAVTLIFFQIFSKDINARRKIINWTVQ